MPWTKTDLPPSAKNLSPLDKARFAAVANAALKQGKSEGEAIRIAHAACNRAKAARKDA